MFSDGTIQNAGNLEVDYNGDGNVDANVLPDGQEEPEPTPEELLQQFRTKLETMQMPSLLKLRLRGDTLLVEYLIKKDRIYLAKLTIKAMEDLIKRRTNYGILPADAQILLGILGDVKDML